MLRRVGLLYFDFKHVAAHGGMTVPLPPEASDAADTPETATLAEAAE